MSRAKLTAALVAVVVLTACSGSDVTSTETTAPTAAPTEAAQATTTPTQPAESDEPVPVPSAGAGEAVAAAVIIVTGRIDLDSGETQLRPTRSLPSDQQPDQSAVGGDYTIELVDEGGTSLGSASFDPTPVADASGNLADFSVTLARPSAPIAAIQVTHAGAQVAELISAGTVPSVTITHPVEGSEVPSSGTVFEWSGSSASDATLYYTVALSVDGGTRWASLLSSSDQTSIRVASAIMTPTTQALLLVSVSDGVNTSFTQVGPFTIQG